MAVSCQVFHTRRILRKAFLFSQAQMIFIFIPTAFMAWGKNEMAGAGDGREHRCRQHFRSGFISTGN